MTWPWVSRSTVERLERELEQVVRYAEALERQQSVVLGNYHDLVKELLELKRAGFERAEPLPEPAVPPEPLPNVVELALDNLGLRGRERLEMEQVVRRRLKEQKPDQVVAELLAGEPVG